MSIRNLVQMSQIQGHHGDSEVIKQNRYSLQMASNCPENSVLIMEDIARPPVYT